MSDKFKYYLTDKDGRSFYEENGVVQLQGQPRNLENTPDGWQDIAIGYERNTTYHGLFRTFSLPLGFVKDGAAIINHVFHKLGFEFKLYLIILKQAVLFNDTEYGIYYKSYYKGEVDLSTFTQEEFKTTVNILDGGIEALIKANENTVYEISLDDKDVVAVLNDGIKLKNNIRYFITDGFIDDPFPYNKNHLVELQEVAKEVDNIGGVKSVSRQKVQNNNEAIRNTGQWFFKATTTSTVTIDYDFILTIVSITAESLIGNVIDVVVRKINADNVGTAYIIFEENQPFDIQGSHHIQGTINVPVVPGDELYLYTMSTVEGATGDARLNFNYSGEGLFKATYFNREPETAISGFFPDVLATKLLNKMSEGKYEFDTSFLIKLREYVITCGDAVRGLAGASIKTSFSDFFQWLWCNFDVFFAIKNGKAYIGELRELYKLPVSVNPIFSNNPTVQAQNQATQLGAIRNLKITLAKDVIFNRIRVGCPNQNYEDINGRTEFNSTQQWTVNVTRDSKELDLVSPYREDSIGIEYTRINFGGKTTTDSSTDNDVFVMHVNKTPVGDIFGLKQYRLDRSANAYLTGVVDPETIYNVKLSPKHKLIRKGRYIRSCIELDSDKLKFQSGEKNTSIAVNYPMGNQVETDSIPIASLGERYFIPKLLEFETYRPIELVELMSSGDYRRHCMQFDWSNFQYLGFDLKVGIQPTDNEVQTYQLLSSHKNDLSKT